MKYEKKFIDVNGKQMAYVDEGSGDTVLFLHGNPTSSYLWRNIAPHVEDTNRIVIPDLIGMGDSEKLDGEDNSGYKYHGQYEYLTGLMDKLDLGDSIHLVIHDWGSAMGFQFARENPSRIKSITYMEAIVMPLTWDQWPDAATKIFGLFRSEAGEELVLEKNFFVERILLGDSLSVSEIIARRERSLLYLLLYNFLLRIFSAKVRLFNNSGIKVGLDKSAFTSLGIFTPN